MVKIGYHASHEQFAPDFLLECVQIAESAGFEEAMCSDHFHPWSRNQGHSGFSFAWLGAALQATSLSFGVVCSPGQRYHPAIVAQAMATLAQMFPERIWSALGSGQLLNEGITGERWPPKPERHERLRECVNVIRALWDGKEVTHEGLIRVEQAKLFTRPERAPLLIGAAVTAETAAWVASWAQGCITVARPHDELKEVVDAFRNNGGKRKPLFLQAQVSYHADEELALQYAHDQWRTNIFQSSMLADTRTPGHFEQAAEFIKPEDLRGPVRISSDLEKHKEWIAQDIGLGFEKIFLHNVAPNQTEFINMFGREVLPAFH